MPPKTQYVKSGDSYIAYQVFGDGSRDLLIVPGFISHLEHQWEALEFAYFLDQLATFSRVIIFDKRGVGLTDRVTQAPSLEQSVRDILTILEATHSDKATILGISEGGPISILFAATYPNRTTALVLYGAFAKGTRAEDHPWGYTHEQYDKWLRIVLKTWGTHKMLVHYAPTHSKNDRFLSWFAKWVRLGANPKGIEANLKMLRKVDVRDVLPAVHVPTLVLHRTGDRIIDVQSGRYIANNIPDAKFVEFPGDDHLWFVGDTDALLNEIGEFLTGVRPFKAPDRMLATVLFTDIVDSTKYAMSLGDHRWHLLLDRHRSIIHNEVERYEGRIIKSTGDGYLATFDSPSRAIRCSRSIAALVRNLDIEIRTGIHTGEIELLEDDLGGIAVHIAARVVGEAGAGETWVTNTVKELIIGTDIELQEQGGFSLKGISGEWQLYQVQE